MESTQNRMTIEPESAVAVQERQVEQLVKPKEEVVKFSKELGPKNISEIEDWKKKNFKKTIIMMKKRDGIK